MGAKIVRTKRQQKNQEAWLKQKQRMIRYLNDNEHLVFFLLGLCFLVMTGILAVAVS